MTGCVILGGMFNFANGNSFSRGGSTERECPLIRRILSVTENRA